MDRDIKITFIGDITCDRPLLNASKIGDNKFDFSGVFSKTREFFKDSDYTVANFETVCGGEKLKYNNEYFLLNTPDQLIVDMKAAGVDFVTTSNNHCLDQGIDGLKRTIELLDKNGVEHTGTFSNLSDDRIKIVDIKGFKIAILAYTYSTNETNTGLVLDENNDFSVGLLKQQSAKVNSKSKLRNFIANNLSAKNRRRLNRFIARLKLKIKGNYARPYTDKIVEGDTDNKYLTKLVQEIQKAKELADYVVVAPHMGGQFNKDPGKYSEFIIDFLLKNGADSVLGNHPHVIQKMEKTINGVSAYSLGGFNQSLSGDYIVFDSLPQYSLGVNLYFEKDSKKLSKSTFTIFRSIEDDKKNLVVYPISELPKEFLTKEELNNITNIYNRITSQNITEVEISKEYII